MFFKKLVAVLGGMALVGTSVLLNGISGAQAASTVGVINLEFKSYVENGQPEQDVFVQSATDPAQVMRVKPDEALFTSNLQREAFSSASTVPHDQFMTGPAPFGPFPGGEDLHFTMQSWLAAKGSGTYILRDDETAALHLSFHKLLPNAVYTVLCSRISSPPNPSADEKTCVAMDGSESALMTDANGNSNFNLELKAPLPDSATGTAAAATTVIALDYHSDGKTCAGTPCDFGLNAHVQLSAQLPDPSQLRKEESRAACQARVLSDKNLTLKNARTNLLAAQKAARLHKADQLKAGSAAHSQALKNAAANRRDAVSAAQKDRAAAIKQANADYLDAFRAAANKDEKEIARENRAAALDKAASDYAVAIDTANAINHANVDRAERIWRADQDAAKSDFDTAWDGAQTIYDSAKAGALAAYHAERVSCLLNT